MIAVMEKNRSEFLAGQAPAPAPDSLLYQIEHVFLPPRPPRSGGDGTKHEYALIEAVQDALVHFRQYFHGAQNAELDECIQTLKWMGEARRGSDLLRVDVLEQQIMSLRNSGNSKGDLSNPLSPRDS